MAQSTPEVRAARRRLRELRRAIPPTPRRAAERAICATLERLGVFRPGSRVAVYLPMPDEVDLRPCLATARRHGTYIYVPRIVSRRRRRMQFVPWQAGTARRTNAFGIVEPAGAAGMRPVVGLDVIVVPVLGFDRHGNRLGMGAGFYDRALHRRRPGAGRWPRPRLIGVAFACQELPAIPISPWDVPLDLIVTERGIVFPGHAATERTDT